MASGIDLLMAFNGGSSISRRLKVELFLLLREQIFEYVGGQVSRKATFLQ